MLSLLVPVLLSLNVLSSPHEARQSTTLKAAASPRYFGAALGAGHLSNVSDPKFAEFGAAQFSGATPENEMKWDFTEPEQGVFTFDQANQVAAFAKANNQILRGHNLVWFSQLPDWVETLQGNDLLNAMNNHITTVMTQFKGQIFAWDVVNEPMADDGTLGPSPFLTQLGSGYIQTALTTARKADNTTFLYINDFNTEGVNAKSDGLLSIVQSLKALNLIDGIGFESHFIVGELPTDIQTNLQRFADAGVDVAITELDVRMTVPPSAADLEQQTKDYATVINACKAVSRCRGITTWGITDLYSWVPGTFPNMGAALLFDDSYNEKASFTSTINALLS
ncbi:glycoside hydrolase [Schizopora paradoxa]|uniref:Beta-xylanase n=1 Tax=Schizopora paradoxa TaxID=27342 RepID=A0A0H2RF24_9AGAM|nr:glycoside hydrolase [Schizopora paradoxa]